MNTELLPKTRVQCSSSGERQVLLVLPNDEAAAFRSTAWLMMKILMYEPAGWLEGSPPFEEATSRVVCKSEPEKKPTLVLSANPQ